MRNEVDEGSIPAGHELIPSEAPEAVYRSPPPLLAIGFVMVGGALILLEIYLVQQVLAGEIRGKLAAIPWILPILIGFFLIRGIANLLNPIIVAVYPHGFAYQRGKQLDFCTWERITTFWSYRQCRPDTLNSYKYWVTRDDGAVFAFKSSRLNDVDDLAGHIYSQVRDRLLAPALAAFQAGERVEFGPVAIDREGLTYRGEHLTWDQIEEASADTDSDFVVKKRGKTYAWCELSTARIPNFSILLELLDERYGGAAA